MSLFNNLAASVFFIGGITFLILALIDKKLIFYITSAALFGLNDMVRFSDLNFLIPVLILLLMLRKRLIWKYVLIAFCVYVICVLPAFILNKELYGSFLSSGYASPIANGGESHGVLYSIYSKLSFFILPSGFHFDQILKNSLLYLVALSPIIFCFGVIGVFRLKKQEDIPRSYIVFLILLTLWEIVYYGSGTYWGHDAFTMDASYIRYFLPVYILVAPLAAYEIAKLKPKLLVLTLAIFAVGSANMAITAQNGLSDMKHKRESQESLKQSILANTKPDSVIITSLGDKYLFPDREVLVYGPYLNNAPSAKNVYTDKKMARMVINTSKQRSNVYLMNDRNNVDIDNITKYISTNSNYQLNEVKNVDSLYVLGAKNEH
jgi:hypothetical protein